ncbi:MAG: response regulator transcription factor [Phycisphaerae bacterium]|nr:response regulator transcription factor [Phycisphaerae bacterium]
MTATLEGKSVLVVDDDEEIRSAVELALVDSGATVRTAADGNAAIDLVREVNPDLIVLDIMLPKRSGFLVLEKLQPKKVKGQRPFVIMITGNEGKRHESYARSMGVDDYLNKPFRMDRLLDTAARLLSAPAAS